MFIVPGLGTVARVPALRLGIFRFDSDPLRPDDLPADAGNPKGWRRMLALS